MTKNYSCLLAAQYIEVMKTLVMSSVPICKERHRCNCHKKRV